MCSRRVMRIFVVLAVILFPIARCFLLMNSINNINGTGALKTMDLELFEESRKRKKKNRYLVGLILGAVLVKMILFPLAVKAMAVMSSVSVLLSTLSLIMSSIVGYAKLAIRKPKEPVVRLVHVNDIWAKGDEVSNDYNISPDSIEYIPNVPLEQIHYTMK